MDASKMENVKVRGRELTCELRNVPVSFANALRRTILSGIPKVVIRDVQILANTTQIPYEMLKHRVEMLPINVHPSDHTTIKEAKIELRLTTITEARNVTTDEFVVESGRESIIMKDPEFGDPILFLKVRAGETVHIVGRLAIETEGVTHALCASYSFHVDPELVKVNRKNYIEKGGDAKLFDNFHYQQSYSRNELGRPNHFDMIVESIGVLPPKEILKLSAQIIRIKTKEYAEAAIKNITREKEANTYNVTLDLGGHTLGVLFQEVIYQSKDVDFVSYDIPHPLMPAMVLRFHTSKPPEEVLNAAAKRIEEYCSVIENNDGAA
jgi:DNA-directed RNA polymerase subunit L